MQAENLSSRRDFRDVSLQVRAGEILGIYGFMGSGLLELTRALFGKVKPSGTLTLEGRTIRFQNTATAKRAGIAFVPKAGARCCSTTSRSTRIHRSAFLGASPGFG
jgi:ribose transport system ATP-binding protein